MEDYDLQNIYASNVQQILNSRQDIVRDALQTAQNNFQSHMQNVLQGTMASAMAIYGAGKTVMDKANEHVQQDMLVRDRAYVLDRSKTRDLMWGLGVAQTDLGQRLQIGGRRPEFLTGGEYAAQMERSVKYRKQELVDMLIGGGAALGAEGIGAAGGMAGGLIAPIAIGLAAQQVVKPFVQPWLDQRKAIREMDQFTSVMDMNHGAGQRRMSEEVSANLAGRFHEQDVSSARYIPFVGGMIAGRLENKTKLAETFKKMAQLDLLRDVDINDISKIETNVKKTIEVMDKYAGIMNTTRDAILHMKGAFEKMGFSDIQQNSAIRNIANFTMSTGYSRDAAMQMHGAFTQMGFQSGYTAAGQGGYGLSEVASLKLLQESNILSRMYDAGTLGMENYRNAVDRQRTPWGKVTQYGGGDLNRTRDYYATLGGGEVTLGMQLKRTSFFADKTNPLDEYERNSDLTVEKLRQQGMSEEKITAYLMSRESTQAGADQAFMARTGLRQLGTRQAVAAQRVDALNKVFVKSEAGGYRLKEIFETLSKMPSEFTSSDSSRTEVRARYEEAMMPGREITKEGNKDLYYKYDWFKQNMGNEFYAAYKKSATPGADPKQEEDNLIKTIVERSGGSVSQEQARQMYYQYTREQETKFGGGKLFKRTFETKEYDPTQVGFLTDYETASKRRLVYGVGGGARGASGDVNKQAYDKISSQISGWSDKKMKRAMDLIQKEGGVVNDFVLRALGVDTKGISGMNEGGYQVNAPQLVEDVIRDTAKYKYAMTNEMNMKVAGMYKTLKSGSGDANKAFEALGINSESDYRTYVVKALGQDFKSIQKGEFDWSNKSEDRQKLIHRLVGTMGMSAATATKIATSLETFGEEGKTKLMEKLYSSFVTPVTDKQMEEYAKNIESGVTDEQAAIKQFTEVLTKLSQALTA